MERGYFSKDFFFLWFKLRESLDDDQLVVGWPSSISYFITFWMDSFIEDREKKI